MSKSCKELGGDPWSRWSTSHDTCSHSQVTWSLPIRATWLYDAPSTSRTITSDLSAILSLMAKNSLPSVILGEVGRTGAVEQEHLPKFA
ncbi:hypothetical protein EMCRGX_G031472 [Ephydatia muelleri]